MASTFFGEVCRDGAEVTDMQWLVEFSC